MTDQTTNTPTSTESADTEKKAFKPMALFLLSLGLSAAGYWVYWDKIGSNFEDTENAYVSANQTAVTASVSGSVIGLYVSDTADVKKGQKAVKVEDIDFKLAFEKAENELARTVRQYRSQQFQELAAKQQWDLKKAELSKAKEDYTREHASFEAGLSSKEQMLSAKLKYEQAQISEGFAKTNQLVAKSQVFSAKLKDIPDVKKAIDAYKQAYIDLARTNIAVPHDGVVAKKAVNIGQKISAGQTLFTVVDVANEWVDANLKESQLKKIKPGQKVLMHSDVNGLEYEGVVQAIGAGSGSAMSLLPAQNATGNWIKVVQRVPVRIALTAESIKTNGVLPVGTSMRVSIDIRTNMPIPARASQELVNAFDLANLDTAIEDIIATNLMDK